MYVCVCGGGGGGGGGSVSWAQQRNSEAKLSPFAALSFTAGLTERVFQSSDGQAQVQTHDLPETFCTISKRL